MRIVFMGTPGFAAESLRHVIEWGKGEIVGVYTQPDRPCGRGQVCKPSDVKKLALEHNLEVFQPVNFKADEDYQQLADLKPDVLLVAAYGLILPQRVLDIPTHGAINVHGSLLPKYRGAAPIQRAILDGQPATGITIMQMEAGLDSGPMMLQRALAIRFEDTASTIHDQLAEMGGRMLVEVLEQIEAGTAHCMPQNHDMATYAPKLNKEEGLIDWDQPAEAIHNRVRAMFPWPGAYFFVDIEGRKKPLRLSLHPGTIGEDKDPDTPPGTVIGVSDGQLAIAAQDKFYLVPKVHPSGKKVMDADGFWCGYMSTCSEAPHACSGEDL